jgi:hypothetical protein
VLVDGAVLVGKSVLVGGAVGGKSVLVGEQCLSGKSVLY